MEKETKIYTFKGRDYRLVDKTTQDNVDYYRLVNVYDADDSIYVYELNKKVKRVTNRSLIRKLDDILRYSNSEDADFQEVEPIENPEVVAKILELGETGKEKGYLIEEEIIKELENFKLTEEELTEIFDGFKDKGIAIVPLEQEAENVGLGDKKASPLKYAFIGGTVVAVGAAIALGVILSIPNKDAAQASVTPAPAVSSAIGEQSNSSEKENPSSEEKFTLSEEDLSTLKLYFGKAPVANYHPTMNKFIDILNRYFEYIENNNISEEDLNNIINGFKLDSEIVKNILRKYYNAVINIKNNNFQPAFDFAFKLQNRGKFNAKIDYTEALCHEDLVYLLELAGVNPEQMFTVSSIYYPEGVNVGGNLIILSPAHAEELGVKVGDTVELPTDPNNDQKTTFTVIAIKEVTAEEVEGIGMEASAIEITGEMCLNDLLKSIDPNAQCPLMNEYYVAASRLLYHGEPITIETNNNIEPFVNEFSTLLGATTEEEKEEIHNVYSNIIKPLETNNFDEVSMALFAESCKMFFNKLNEIEETKLPSLEQLKSFSPRLKQAIDEELDVIVTDKVTTDQLKKMLEDSKQFVAKITNSDGTYDFSKATPEDIICFMTDIDILSAASSPKLNVDMDVLIEYGQVLSDVYLKIKEPDVVKEEEQKTCLISQNFDGNKVLMLVPSKLIENKAI